MLGILSTGLGVLLGLYLIFARFVQNVSVMAQHGPLLVMGVALCVSGMQFLSIGLLGELMARTYYESQNKPIYALREVKSHRKEAGDSAERARPFGTSDH